MKTTLFIFFILCLISMFFIPTSLAAVCPEGEITETCTCNGVDRSSGYCCTGIWDQSACRVLNYGFEDWTGDADTTPGYFSSTAYQEYWITHESSTEVISSCNGNYPHSGNYYFHQNFYTKAPDPCLGTTPDSVNPHTNIGVNLAYPSNPKNNLNIRSDVLSDIMTIRFYFRATGNWPNAVTNSLKFIRVSGGGTSSQILCIPDYSYKFDIVDRPHPNNPDPGWSDYHNVFNTPIDLIDGSWHSVVMVTEILNGNNIPDNIGVSVWWDNWDMQGAPDGYVETYQPGFGSEFNHVTLFVNWGATYPNRDMGIDLDDIEIWDGIPQTTSYKVSTTLQQTGQPELLNGIPNITNNAVSTTLPQTDQSELFKWISVLIIILALLYFVWAKQYL